MSERYADFLTTDPNTPALVQPPVQTDRIGVVRANVTYYAPPFFNRPFSFEIPVAAGTVTMTAGYGATILSPVATIDVLEVILPPTPVNGDQFQICATQDITNLSVTAPGGAVVSGGTINVLAQNGGCAFLYRQADNTWYRLV